jgi:hypothetical protein
MVRTCGTTGKHSCRMPKKARLLTRPTSARRDAPCPKQGRNSAADPRFTFHASRFTIPESHARTLLADFFSILLKLVERLIPEDSECSSCV